MRNTKKNINKDVINDPIFEAKKDKNFGRYSQEIDLKIRIAKEVYNMREQKCLSQQSLAKMAATTQRIISDIENADLNPGTILLFRVAKALDFTSHNISRIYDCPELFYVANNSGTFKSLPVDTIKVNN
ncbi:MAG: helix-turn-helix transcriptional regulator [Candidatus Pacebacteria bacterium]|nr:helix-turn-helix transcriptional regulator [Candidatus Paceibacterota bacterium]